MSNYSSNPNQRSILINRDMPQKESKEKYLAVYEKNLTAAAQELSEAPFKLYIYLLCNKDKYDLWFSPKVFAGIYGLNKDTARRAFNTLVELGYIIECGKNQYSFHETPQKKSSLTIERPAEKRVVSVDNVDTPMTYADFYKLAKLDNWTDTEINEIWNTLEVVEL